MDKEKGKLDMTNLKVTNLSKNPRLYEPRAAINDEELKIQTQRLEILRRGKETIKNLDKKETNLTEKELRGKLKLQKRIKNKEFIVYPTDKSGKLLACLPSTYLEAGAVHTNKDVKVEWTELPKVEQLINRHTRALGKILKRGQPRPPHVPAVEGPQGVRHHPAYQAGVQCHRGPPGQGQ